MLCTEHLLEKGEEQTGGCLAALCGQAGTAPWSLPPREVRPAGWLSEVQARWTPQGIFSTPLQDAQHIWTQSRPVRVLSYQH